ncbi:MAG TPA: hypothetical protein VK212_02855 [Lentimicrobium sp.]|nr:hypothetical protein [Lentimicrobium sp.]
MKKNTLLFVLLTFALSGFTQNCESWFPAKKGSFIEMKSYDDKDKLTGIVRQTVTDVTNLSDGIAIKVHSQSLDEKEKMLTEQDLEMRCEDGMFYMDMKNFYNQPQGGNKDAEVTIDATDLVFPASLSVGQALPDGNMTMTYPAGPMTMTMGVHIMNRQVVAQESITTPAGTFDCYKITYDIELKMPVKMTSSAIQWYAKDAGAVRTETFNKRGKLIGYTLLTALNK